MEIFRLVKLKFSLLMSRPYVYEKNEQSKQTLKIARKVLFQPSQNLLQRLDYHGYFVEGVPSFLVVNNPNFSSYVNCTGNDMVDSLHQSDKTISIDQPRQENNEEAFAKSLLHIDLLMFREKKLEEPLACFVFVEHGKIDERSLKVEDFSKGLNFGNKENNSKSSFYANSMNAVSTSSLSSSASYSSAVSPPTAVQTNSDYFQQRMQASLSMAFTRLINLKCLDCSYASYMIIGRGGKEQVEAFFSQPWCKLVLKSLKSPIKIIYEESLCEILDKINTASDSNLPYSYLELIEVVSIDVMSFVDI